MSNKVKTTKMKQDKQGLVPKLRFPEFEDDGEWEEKKLGDVGEIITGSTPPTNEREYYGGEYLFVSPFDIQDKRYIKNTKTTLTKLGFLNGRRVKKGSSLFVCIGSTIGKVAQAKYDCTTNQQINSIVPTLNNEDFVFFLLQFHSSEIQKLKAEQAVPIINKTTFSNYVLSIPNSPEQQKIADCLSSIDELIVAESEKLESIKNHKKGLMQNLFPRDGKTTPRLRFPEFKNDGDWEENQLSDIIQNFMPPKKIPTAQYCKSGSFPIIDQSQNQIAGWTDDQEAIINKKFPLIVFGDHTCALKIISQPFAQGADGIKIFRGSSEIATDYLYQYLQFNPLKMEEYKRHFSILKNKKVFYPDKDTGEQQKIADCLSSIDDLITSQTQKIDALKKHKKGLMQQLFPNVDEVLR